MALLRYLVSVLVTVTLACEALAVEKPAHHDTYRIGPNDVIRIQVFGEEDLSMERKVGGDGKLEYPLLGAVPTEGKTIEELQRYLTTQLASGYLRHPKVSVTIVRHRNFYVSGEVKTPGGLPYEEGLTLQQAIALSGGLTEKADKAGVRVKRVKGQIAETLALEPDALIMPDDVIMVAPARKFYVNGEVRKPGDYSFEKGLTVHKAVTMAGGFTEKASKGSTKVLRSVDGQEKTFEITLDSPIQPEDIIVVPQRFF
jgi:protein involved in polysaccharide export with SLBB domain